MALRIAGCADAEITGCLDLGNELRSIAVIMFYFSILRNIPRRASTFSMPCAFNWSRTECTFSLVEETQVRCANGVTLGL